MKKLFKISLLLIFVIIFSSCKLSFFNNKEKKEDEKEELSLDAFHTNTTFYKYTGEPITIEKDVYFLNKEGRRANGSTFDYSYENNIEPGIATVTITARNDTLYFTGSVVYEFEIKLSDDGVDVSSFNELKEVLDNPKKRHINLINDITIPVGETITIKDTMCLNVGYYKTLEGFKGATLKNYGTINVNKDGFIEVGCNNYYCELYNYGTMNINGNLIALNNGYIYNSNTIDATGIVKVFGALYTNSNISNVNRMNTNSKYIIRKDISLLEVEYDKDLKYNENIELNKPTIYIDGIYIPKDDIEYVNYDKVGLASLSINISDNNPNFYGSKSIDYNIYKGSITVKSFSELQEKKETNNFNIYNINPSTSYIYIDEDLIINNDETFNFDCDVKLNGSITNLGIINMIDKLYNNITSTEFYFINNDGIINLNDGSISSYFIKLINGKINSLATIEGAISVYNLTNYGNIICNKTISNVLNDLINYGNIEVNSNINIKNLTNEGTFIANKNFIINEDGFFINLNNGNVTLNGESLFKGTSFTNSSSLTNNNKLSILDSNAIVINTGVINNNNGVIYAFKTLNNVNDNFILREYLSNDNISLEYTSFVYDGLIHNPNCYLDGQLYDSYSGISISVKKNGEFKNDNDLKDTGDYTKVFKVYSNFIKYAGTIELNYSIDYASFHITDSKDFDNILNNKNYNLIFLDTDVNLSSSRTILISSHQTLDLNGCKLRINSKFENWGKLIVSNSDAYNNIDDVSLLIGRSSGGYVPLFSNHGIIINNGVILVNKQEVNNAELISYNNSNIINNGIIYTQDNALIIDTNSLGSVYMRKFLDFDNNNIVMEYDNIDYTGNYNEPNIDVYFDNNKMNINDYDITYSNNLNAGVGRVEIKPVSVFNPIYYGTIYRQFIIKRSVKLLTDLNEALDGSNYYKFKLANNIISCDTVYIPNNCIFDLDIYRINNINGKISFGTNTSFEVSVSTIEDYNKFIGVASKIKLVSDIGVSNEANNISITSGIKGYTENQMNLFNNDKNLYANYVYINNKKIDLFIDEVKYVAGSRSHTIAKRWFVINSNPVSFYEGLPLLNTTVDLNGYSILCNLRFYLDKEGFNLDSDLIMNYSYINTSEFESCIGSNNDSVGFLINGYQDYKGLTTFNFDNVTVYGVDFSIGYLNGDVRINGNNSKFTHNSLPALYIGGDHNNKTQVNKHIATNFTACTFLSNNNTSVVIRSGTNIFDSCSIVSLAPFSSRSGSNIYYSGCGIYAIQNVSSEDREIIITLTNTTIKSQNGYGIVKYITDSRWQDRIIVTYDSFKIEAGLEKYYIVR